MYSNFDLSNVYLQLPFSQSSGFTPIKLPFGADDAPDNFSSVPSTPAKSLIGSAFGSPFSGFSLPEVIVITVKILKIGTPKIITVIVLQMKQLHITVQYCGQKMQTE